MGHKPISVRKTLLFSVLLTALVWVCFSWPLPRHVFSGIPSSSTNVEKNNVRRMTAGDHLQLHYVYWLFTDMLAGRTPLFYNVYEFNTGDDSARKHVGIYNMPFSLVYAAGAAVAGSALGWNLTGFMTLWLTHLFTWLLVRRFIDNEWIAGLSALAAIMLPYRWITLCGGSPTGFAMMWIPVLLYGLDLASRDNSPWGGLLAGAALVLSYLNDRHIFFFGMLFLPAWYLIGFARRQEFRWSRRDFVRSVIKGALPLIAICGVLVAIAFYAKKTGFTGTNVASGRKLFEIEKFSPAAGGLIRWRAFGTDAHAYIGFALPAMLILHALFTVFFSGVRSSRRHATALLVNGLLWIQIVLCVVLVLGPKGPFGGGLFSLCRKLIPAYDMIRQSDKIFCILPSLLAVSAAIAVADLVRVSKTRRGRIFLPAVLAVLFISEYACQVRTTVCLLDTEQEAYAAVAADTEKPRALIVPLWPGDSAWASLYEHYVSLYRIRMVNGYRPVISDEYRENVFRRFSSVNPGTLTDSQIKGLQDMGINYIILHANAFPEKVSPFPVYYTLKRLLTHPRLDLLKQGEDVWAFKIRESAREPVEVGSPADVFFPSRRRRWEIENLDLTNGVVHIDESVGNRHFATLAQGASVTGRSFRHWSAPEPFLKIRIRGQGSIAVTLDAGKQDIEVLPVDSREWIWLDISLAEVPERVSPRIECRSGSVDLDTMLYMSGQWKNLRPGESVRLAAYLFFNAGVIHPDTGSLTFRTDYEADSLIFFGPRLPLEVGRYKVTLDFETAAEAGTELGSFIVKTGADIPERHPVVAGKPAVALFDQQHNLPVSIRFHYSRNAEMTMHGVVLERMP